MSGLACSAFGLHRGGGESLALLDAGGIVVDRVVFPAMPPDVSYARDFDGSRYLGYNPEPTLGEPNSRPRNLEPILSPENPFRAGGGRIGVAASAFDDVGVAYAAVSFRLEDGTASGELPLHDDGRHGDGLAGDGVFGAVLPEFPAGSTVLYSLRIVDLEGGAVEAPSQPGEGLLRVRVPPPEPRLEIAEVMADADAAPAGEAGRREDWLEVVNCGEVAASLDGLALTKDFLDETAAWRFPAGLRLAPGARLVVTCDGEVTRGPLHAGFRLDRDGDQVLIVQPGSPGQPAAVIDAMGFGPLSGDTAFGRLECGGEPQVLARPTPGEANVGAVPFRRGDATADGVTNLTDPISILNFLFLGGSSPPCPDAADADDSGGVDITDAVRILNFLFLGGSPPPAPFPACGADPSQDGLECTAFPCG
jgi:hypothetical protein